MPVSCGVAGGGGACMGLHVRVGSMQDETIGTRRSSSRVGTPPPAWAARDHAREAPRREPKLQALRKTIPIRLAAQRANVHPGLGSTTDRMHTRAAELACTRAPPRRARSHTRAPPRSHTRAPPRLHAHARRRACMHTRAAALACTRCIAAQGGPSVAWRDVLHPTPGRSLGEFLGHAAAGCRSWT